MRGGQVVRIEPRVNLTRDLSGFITQAFVQRPSTQRGRDSIAGVDQILSSKVVDGRERARLVHLEKVLELRNERSFRDRPLAVGGELECDPAVVVETRVLERPGQQRAKSVFRQSNVAAGQNG